MGLVVYADDAYTVAPLTDDGSNVALYLDALSPDVMPRDGQRADRGIDWATRLMRQIGLQGQILLVSDQADSEAALAAAQARSLGLQVSVLGLGTPAGAAYRDGSGQIRQAAWTRAACAQWPLPVVAAMHASPPMTATCARSACLTRATARRRSGQAKASSGATRASGCCRR